MRVVLLSLYIVWKKQRQKKNSAFSLVNNLQIKFYMYLLEKNALQKMFLMIKVFSFNLMDI